MYILIHFHQTRKALSQAQEILPQQSRYFSTQARHFVAGNQKVLHKTTTAQQN